MPGYDPNSSRSVFSMRPQELHSSSSMNNANLTPPIIDASTSSEITMGSEKRSSSIKSTSPPLQHDNKHGVIEPVASHSEDGLNATDAFAALNDHSFKSDGAGLDDGAPFVKIPSTMEGNGRPSQENLASFDAFGGKQ